MKYLKSDRSGFTLIELLVVLDLPYATSRNLSKLETSSKFPYWRIAQTGMSEFKQNTYD